MELEILKRDYEGRGIAKLDGKTIFVSNALPGEIVDASIIHDEKTYSIARTNSILKESDKRVVPFCPYDCDGCSYKNTSYKDSIEAKKEAIKELLDRKGIYYKDIAIEENRPVLMYRNKITLKVENYKLGYYREESHEFVPIRKCMVAKSEANIIISNFDLFKFKNGELTIRVNSKSEVLLIIDTKDNVRFKEELTFLVNLKGIILNGEVVYGTDYFIEKRDDIKYKIRYDSFFQVNDYIPEVISKDISSLFNKNDKVLDLYSGVGYFSLKIAKLVNGVVGVEVNREASLLGTINAKDNNISNVLFNSGRVEDLLKKLDKSYNKVIVDPPRAGLASNVVRYLNDNKFDIVVYVSCNSLTLVRDLTNLDNYNIMSIKLYDMFSYSKHVETVCVLERK